MTDKTDTVLCNAFIWDTFNKFFDRFVWVLATVYSYQEVNINIFIILQFYTQKASIKSTSFRLILVTDRNANL